MDKKIRVRISNGKLNSYGSRVLTDGVDTSQYERNPVLLYMHKRGDVIGYVKELRKDGDELTGELVFDEASELSTRCKKQFEVGSLRMVSAGLEILATSDQPEHLLQGQTSPTITQSRLFEVSVVDVGANDDALVLYDTSGERITLGKGSSNPLPEINKPKNEIKMNKEKIALQLGLASTADEAEITAAIAKLKADAQEAATLKAEKEKLTLAGITSEVDSAITRKLIASDKKEHFVNLGKTIGLEALQTTFASMSPNVKLSGMLTP